MLSRLLSTALFLVAFSSKSIAQPPSTGATPIIKHAEFEDTYDEAMHPIPSLTVVDVWAPLKTGGADLIMVVASPLQADEHSRSRLRSKLDLYIRFLKDPAFLAETHAVTPTNTSIIVKLHPKSDPVVLEILKGYKSWVGVNGATLKVETLREPGK